MKIVRIPSVDERPWRVEFLPDGTLTPSGRPVFIPDLLGDWKMSFYMAARISRLGKGMNLKFASRYYDAFALAVRISPVDPSRLMPGLLTGMDGTLTHGPWISPEEAFTLKEITVEYPVACTRTFSLDPFCAEAVAQGIVMVGGVSTFRMGDLLLIPLKCAPEIEIFPRSRLKAVSGTELLSVKFV